VRAESLAILQFMEHMGSSAQACQHVTNALTWKDPISSDKRSFGLHDLFQSLFLWQECQKRCLFSVKSEAAGRSTRRRQCCVAIP